MELSRYDKAAILIIVLLLSAAGYLYPSLPGEIPTHWNAAGEVDDYSSKWTVFLIPIIAALILELFLILPKIAVFKKNILSFKHFDSMKFVIVLFFAIIYGATVLPNFGYTFNMTKIILPLIALLFFYFGLILPSAKRNFFIGIRTPWTLSSDKVWEKTHKLGGKIFIKLGILMLVGVFVPAKYMVWFILVPILVAVGYIFVYSYVLWKKEGKKSRL